MQRRSWEEEQVRDEEGGPFGTILETSRSLATVGSWTPWYLVSLRLHSRCRIACGRSQSSRFAPAV